jgi:hypothetical protein
MDQWPWLRESLIVFSRASDYPANSNRRRPRSLTSTCFDRVAGFSKSKIPEVENNGRSSAAQHVSDSNLDLGQENGKTTDTAVYKERRNEKWAL